MAIKAEITPEALRKTIETIIEDEVRDSVILRKTLIPNKKNEKDCSIEIIQYPGLAAYKASVEIMKLIKIE